MKVLLVRHGETDYNVQGLLQGYGPIPLNARGRTQAALVATRLQSLRPTVLYSSDILRAHETATIISQRLGLAIQPCPGLREWNIGQWAEQPAATFYAHLQARGAHPVTYVPEGGESQLQTQERMIAEMHAWAERHAGATVLGISHGLAIDLFLRHTLGLDVMREPRYHIGNSSVTIVQYDRGVWNILTLNDVGHLEAGI